MNRLPVYLIYAWTLINIGRPQDVFPFLKDLRPAVVIGGLSTLAFLALWKTRKPVFSYPELKLFLALCALSAISGAFGNFPKISLYFLWWFCIKFGIYLYLLSQLIHDRKAIDGLLKVMVISGFLMATGTLLSMQPGIRAAIGTTYDPNDMAMLMVAILPIAIVQGMISKRSSTKYLFYMVAVLCVFALIGTKSRGGFLGLVVASSYILFIKMGGLKKRRIVGLFIILGILFSIKVGPEYISRMSTIWQDASSVESGSGRVLVWKRALVMFGDNPILGVGPNCFVSTYGRYIADGSFKGEISTKADRWAPRRWRTAHNSFLLILTEMGIFGFVIYMAFIVRVFRNLRRTRSLVTGSKDYLDVNYQAIGIQIAFVGYLVCAFFLSQTYGSLLYIFVVLSGAMLRLVSTQAKTALSEGEKKHVTTA